MISNSKLVNPESVIHNSKEIELAIEYAKSFIVQKAIVLDAIVGSKNIIKALKFSVNQLNELRSMIEIRRAVKDNVVTHKDDGLAEFEISEVNEFYEWCISLNASQNAFLMKPYLGEELLALSQETAFGEECKAMHVAKHVCAPRENKSINLLKEALRIFITSSNDVSWNPRCISPLLYLYLFLQIGLQYSIVGFQYSNLQEFRLIFASWMPKCIFHKFLMEGS